MSRNEHHHLTELVEQLVGALDAQQAAMASTTAELAQWRNLQINGVLFAGTVTLSGTAAGNAAGVGTVSLNPGTPYGGAAIWNQLGAGVVTVQTDGPGGDIPAMPSPGSAQPGRLVIPAAGFWCGPLTGRSLTVYGAAGTSLVVVLTVLPLNPGA